MRYRSNGGVIGPVVTTNTSVAPGVWAIPDFQQKLSISTWPTDQTASLLAEPYFDYNTLLMKATGSNTQQNYTFVDSSSLAATITRNGDVTQGAFSPFSYADGRWAAYFDGNGDYLNTPSNAAVAPTGSFTIEMWFYGTTFVSTNSGDCGLIYIGDIANNNGRLQLGIASTGLINWFISNTAGTQVISLSSSTGVIATNTWYHIACVKDGTTYTIYVNGTSVATTTSATAITYTANIANIGLRRASNLNHFWNGYISNVRIVSSAVYTSSFTPSSSGLTAIASTALLTCQSNRFRDNSSNSFTITRNGDVKISSFGPFNPDSVYTTGVNGGAAYFDGNGDFLSCAANTAYAFGTGDFTVEAWIMRTGGSGNQPIMQSDAIGSSTNDKWWFAVAGGGLFFGTHSSGGFSVVTTTTFNTYEWYHVAVTRSSGTMRMFVNGTNTAFTTTGTPSGYNLSQNGLVVGGMSTPSYWTGFITDARVIKGTALYTNSFTIPTSPLSAVANTSFLLNATNAGIIDASRKVQLYTFGNAQVSNNVIKYDKSVYFDGTGDYILVPSSTYNDEYLFGTGDFTVETWIRFNALASNRVFIDAWVSGQSASWQLYFQSSTSKFVWYVGASAVLSSTTTPLVNTWYHVAVARSSSTIRMFVNGSLEANTTSHTTNYNYKAPLALGVQYSTLTNYLNGYMEDTRITRGYARYTANFTPPPAQLNTL